MNSKEITIQDVKEIYLVNPGLCEIKQSIKQLQELMGYDKKFPHQKILVKFLHPTVVRINRRKVKELNEMRVKFFSSIQGNFCYTFNKSSGYPLQDIDVSSIYSMAIFGEETDAQKKKKIGTFLKKFHPNAWDDIKKEPGKISDYGIKTQSIIPKFPKSVIERLKAAFENKERYNYKTYGDRWDLSLETKLCEDGIFRAWYSCEYSGCGNGHYYILINPTTAAMREDD